MASRGVNKVIIVGNLGQDPEVRFMPNGSAVANFTVATSETWKDKQSGDQKEKTEWHRIVIYQRLAEIAGEYLKKGATARVAKEIDDEIKKQVMATVTDSKGENDPKDPTSCNVFALHKHFSKEQLSDIKKRYINGKIGYRESKEILIENLIAFIAPLREKRGELAKDTDAILHILEKGSKVAREKAGAKMKEVKEKIGILV